jgi:hypothetical protein
MLLIEGAKISQQLLNKALADPNFTFGIEAEFFLVGARSFLTQQMTQDLDTGDNEGTKHFVKKLGDVTWHDVLHYFTPLGVQGKETKTDHEVMNHRLLNSLAHSEYAPDTKSELASISPEAAWAALQQQYGVHELMALLQVFPEHRMLDTPANQIEIIHDIVYDSEVEEIAPFNKLNAIMIALGEVDNENDKIDFNKDIGSRDTIYNLVTKELSERLGQRVVYTTDSNHVYHVSNQHEHWVVTEDGISLSDTERENDAVGIELVSPVMNAQDGMAMLERVLSIMNEGILGLKVVTTEKTGLHINLGVQGQEIDPVKILVLSGDEYMVNKFNRATNDNAASIQAEVQKRMRAAAQSNVPATLTPNDLVQTASMILRSIKVEPKDLERAIGVLNSLKPEGKAHSIDFNKLHSGYVEYRAIGNQNYHKRAAEIREVVLHMIGMTYIATQPDAYRQEYMKKLYIMVQRAVEDHADINIMSSVGVIGGGTRGGYGSSLEQYRDSPYDGENYVQRGFDPGSNTQ